MVPPYQMWLCAVFPLKWSWSPWTVSYLPDQRVPTRVVMDILGRSQMATTSDLYAHVMPAAHREVADLLDHAMAADG
jgi:hypothetical protein